mgnify:CR=1 FL=1
MFKKLSLSIALYSLLITPLSPLGVLESYNIVDFVNRNFQTDDQSKPNRVKTHYTLSYQSPNILTNIEGVPNSDTQSQVSSQITQSQVSSQMPQMPRPTVKFSIVVSQIDVNESALLERTIYIVEQVRALKLERVMRYDASSNGQSGQVLYR